ncbi:prominin family protein [Aureispira anguillae]|nr:prominin family protein [Aureispira anguillae]
MKIIHWLFPLIFITTFPSFPPLNNNNSPIAFSSSVSYGIAPPAEKKTTHSKKRKAKRQKHKRNRKYKKHPNNVTSKKAGSRFLTLGIIFSALFLGFLLASIIILAGFGTGAFGLNLLILFPTVLMFLIGTPFLFIGLYLTLKANKVEEPIKRSETELRKEVANLPEREIVHYLELNDALAAEKIKIINFDRNLKSRRAAGVPLSELKRELDEINRSMRVIKKEISILKKKAQNQQ